MPVWDEILCDDWKGTLNALSNRLLEPEIVWLDVLPAKAYRKKRNPSFKRCMLIKGDVYDKIINKIVKCYK